jgi:hypothetical protein
MPRCNVLIVAVDGLRASTLGAYGNTSFATPVIDAFAAESYLLDFCFAPAADLTDVYRALWQSRHPLRPAETDQMEWSLPGLLASCGYSTTLVTDEIDLMSLPETERFDRCVQVAARPPDEIGARAKDVTQTAMARLFAAGCDALESQGYLPDGAGRRGGNDSPGLVWIHSRGMYGPWDAPLEFQHTLREEGDPPPLEAAESPNLFISEAADPDTAFRYSCAYVAQTMVFDLCWRGLMEACETARLGEPWLMMLVGIRGFPLGEHWRIGGVEERLYGEQLHVPWLIQFPGGHGRLARSAALTSHVDLLPTIVQWIGEDRQRDVAKFDGINLLPLTSAAKANWRDALFAMSRPAGSSAIRTANWCLLQHNAADHSGRRSTTGASDAELYVRPDDRWEANDVAKICPDIVEQLARASDSLALQITRGLPLPATVLSDLAPADVS